MTRTNWILFAGSLLILIFVLVRNNRHHAKKPGHEVTAKAFEWPERPGAFGFYMMLDGDTVIRQACIPAIQGKYAFASLEDAQKAGDCMARRFVAKPVELPSLTLHDLDSLGIKHP